MGLSVLFRLLVFDGCLCCLMVVCRYLLFTLICLNDLIVWVGFRLVGLLVTFVCLVVCCNSVVCIGIRNGVSFFII